MEGAENHASSARDSPRVGLVVALVLVGLDLGCPQSIREYCDSNTCPDGCCDGPQCRTGTSAGACGEGGGTCSVCVSSSGQVCTNHICGYPADAGAPDGSIPGDAAAPDSGADSGVSSIDSGTGPDGGTRDAGSADAGCTPDCAGKSCGSDGCTGSCGTCPTGESCNAGLCAGPPTDGGLCNPGPCTGPTIAAGGVHSCALNSIGALRCWGTNINGELGNNTNADSPTPVDVQGLGSGVSAVAAGDWHTCAIISGSLQCWGSDQSGEIGDGLTFDQWVPTSVQRVTSVTQQISAGSVHTCAVTTSSGAKCWGSNLFGQIGDGSGADQHLAVDVLGLTASVAAITTGGHYGCALLTGGTAKCWGDDSSGQLGDGNSGTTALAPVSVKSLTGATAISAGGYTTCVIVAGGVSCWGANDMGQVGKGSTSLNPEPVTPVVGLSGAVQALTVGGSHACALIAGGTVQCWGSNKFGQIGDNTFVNRPSATTVQGLTPTVAEIAAGAAHTCARMSTGAVACWGRGAEGQLGNGGGATSPLPVVVSSL